MFPLIGSLISAGANLFGGLSGQQNQADINRQNIMAQEAINAQNIAEQEKFAQSGVQWRVADARAAGINPLAALGAQTGSFSNVVAPKVEASNSFGAGVAAAGQDLSRAVSATRSPEEQAVAIEKTRQDLESGQLDNEIKRAQLASSLQRVSGPHVGPGINKPVDDRLPHPLDPRMGLPSDTEHNWTANPDGSINIYSSKADEGTSWASYMAKLQYDMRTWGLPTLGVGRVSSSFLDKVSKTGPAKEGEAWWPDPTTGQYRKFPDLPYYAGKAWDRLYVSPFGK